MTNKNDDFNSDDLNNIIENAEAKSASQAPHDIDASLDGQPVDVPLHKLSEGAVIAENENGELVEVEEDLPDINIAGRDSTNSTKLRMVVLGMVALLVMLLGMGVAFSRYQKNKELAKAQEAEEAIRKEQQVDEGSKLDIASDQQQIANNNLRDLPPPAGAMTASGVAPMQTVEPVQPVQPIEPVIVRNANDNAPPAIISNPPPIIDTPTSNPTPPVTVTEEVPNSRASNGMSNIDMPPPTAEQLKQDRILKSNVLAYEGKGKAVATSAEDSDKNNKFGNSFKSSVMADGQAGKRGNLSMLLAKGSTIPCVMTTKIVSDYQGFTTCQSTKDVYSANGKVLLIERGSKAFGEQSVELTQGKASVFVLWSKVETPKGVSINLDSPASGSLGEMGIPAKVNTHFWKRFGNSIMLSVIQDGIATIAKNAENNNDTQGDNNTIIANTTRNTQSMAEKALENSINIPPTATVKQGALINILVVRDVDFSKVYRVR